jgi:RNA polymerase sigma-70 factor (ECF subfamily)
MTAQEQEALFRRWLADHTGLMWKVVRAFTEAPEDQKDLLQEIALQLWMSAPSFHREAAEGTWIYRVALNTALAWKRGEKRRAAKHEKFLQWGGEQDLALRAFGQSEDAELVEQLYAAIRRLPKLDASLALMHLDGLDYRAMSDVLGITENHVGVKLNRIRKQLAEMLKGVHDEL